MRRFGALEVSRIVFLAIYLSLSTRVDRGVGSMVGVRCGGDWTTTDDGPSGGIVGHYRVVALVISDGRSCAC